MALTDDPYAELKKIRELHASDLSQNTLNCLIQGQVGSGKTHLLGTCPRPLLIHSFDPGGSKTLKDLINKSDDIIVDSRFERDDTKKPTAYALWEKTFESYMVKDSKGRCMFDSVGTFAIDSATTWLMALHAQIAKAKGRVDGQITQPDWGVLTGTVRDVVKLATALPCHFILLGHLTMEKDEVEGKMIGKLAANPKLQEVLPTLFDEIYVADTYKDAKGGIKHRLLTKNDGKFQCRTRVGGNGRFETYEEPDIRALLRKAGLPFADKIVQKSEQTDKGNTQS